MDTRIEDEGDEEVLAVCAQTREIFGQADRKRITILDTLREEGVKPSLKPSGKPSIKP